LIFHLSHLFSVLFLTSSLRFSTTSLSFFPQLPLLPPHAGNSTTSRLIPHVFVDEDQRTHSVDPHFFFLFGKREGEATGEEIDTEMNEGTLPFDVSDFGIPIHKSVDEEKFRSFSPVLSHQSQQNANRLCLFFYFFMFLFTIIHFICKDRHGKEKDGEKEEINSAHLPSSIEVRSKIQIEDESERFSSGYRDERDVRRRLSFLYFCLYLL
jgi:hypothetical protein